jgi:hypothetical protein
MENKCFGNALLVILHVSLAFTLICCTQIENGSSAMAPCHKIYGDMEKKIKTFLIFGDRVT